jgi:hypothetical protein
MSAASAAQLLDILRGVLRSAEEEDGNNDVAALLKWAETADSASAVSGALAADGRITELEEFIGGAPDMTTCFTHTIDALAADILPPPFPRDTAVAAFRELQRRWVSADLSADDDEGGAEQGATVQALNKAKSQQLPVVLMVLRTLRMFPPAMSEKLDKQAAAVGESVRRNAGEGKSNPAEMLSSIMQSPVFAQMIQEVMQPPSEEPNEADLQRQKMEDARFSVIEMRLTALEKRPPVASPKKIQAVRNRKRQGGRAETHTPSY